MPTFFVTVETQRLRELGIPLRDVAGDLVRLPKPRLFRAKRRVEERDRRAPLLFARPRDGLREVELVVVHTLAALTKKTKPE